MHLSHLLSTVAILACHSTNASPTNAQKSLPVVDLGYVKQQASSFNQSGKYYEFGNIAFAQPPLGDLRWQSPQPPLPKKGIQNGGSSPIMCPQGTPEWLATELFGTSTVAPKKSENEDCLYLDVFVPQKIFEKRGKSSNGSAVIVWIYGGGFALGSKNDNSPSGLLQIGGEDASSDGIIFVAMNYRLGYFGFLSGPTYRHDGGVSNLGLLDARFAIEWVQKNIQKFGGDPARITLMGESGGATSVTYQITKPFTYNDTKPFQGVVLQSPGQSPALQPSARVDSYYKEWLSALNVTNLTEARALDTKVLQKANRDLIHAYPDGQFLLTASADNVTVTDTAPRSLVPGNFDPSIKVMTAYNDNEGLIFVPNKTLVPTFTDLVRLVFPDASAKEVHELVNNIYPPPGPKTPYTTDDERRELFAGDQLINCNTVGVAQHVHNANYAYKFSVSSPLATGFHTQDLNYTFYTGTEPGVNATVAKTMQSLFVNFAIHGDPNYSHPSTPALPIYGSDHHMLNLTSAGFQIIKDNSNNARCKYLNTVYTQPA